MCEGTDDGAIDDDDDFFLNQELFIMLFYTISYCMYVHRICLNIFM